MELLVKIILTSAGFQKPNVGEQQLEQQTPSKLFKIDSHPHTSTFTEVQNGETGICPPDAQFCKWFK